VAILSALLAPSLFTDSATRNFELGKPELLVAIPTLLFALKTRSLGGTVLIGMLLYWLTEMILNYLPKEIIPASIIECSIFVCYRI